nr:MAG TPA: hypothetical protein [Caudoviricetes sp.]
MMLALILACLKTLEYIIGQVWIKRKVHQLRRW